MSHDSYMWPYHSGQPVVDVVLWGVFCVLFGLFVGWGWRVAQKQP